MQACERTGHNFSESLRPPPHFDFKRQYHHGTLKDDDPTLKGHKILYEIHTPLWVYNMDSVPCTFKRCYGTKGWVAQLARDRNWCCHVSPSTPGIPLQEVWNSFLRALLMLATASLCVNQIRTYWQQYHSRRECVDTDKAPIKEIMTELQKAIFNNLAEFKLLSGL